MASPTSVITFSITTTFTLDAAYTSAPPASTTTASPSATPTEPTSRLSPSAALGIGFAAGVLTAIILITATLFMYRCWNVRRSPAVQHYEQARLWKGFIPATPNPNTARTTLVQEKMESIYFTQIRSPAFTLSPPLSAQVQGWPGALRDRGEERVV